MLDCTFFCVCIKGHFIKEIPATEGAWGPQPSAACLSLWTSAINTLRSEQNADILPFYRWHFENIFLKENMVMLIEI